MGGKNAGIGRKGYALLTVVCVFALFVVLGITLLTASAMSMQSAQRKLHSAQVDTYCVSMAQTFNTLAAEGRLDQAASALQQAIAASDIPAGTNQLTLAKGTPAAMTFDPVQAGGSSPATVAMSVQLYYAQVTLVRDPEYPDDTSKRIFSGTLEADITVTCTLDGQQVSQQFHSEYGHPADNPAAWTLLSFEKRRDYAA